MLCRLYPTPLSTSFRPANYQGIQRCSSVISAAILYKRVADKHVHVCVLESWRRQRGNRLESSLAGECSAIELGSHHVRFEAYKQSEGDLPIRNYIYTNNNK